MAQLDVEPDPSAFVFSSAGQRPAFHTSGLGISRLSLPNLVLWGHSGGIFGYRTLSYHSADATHQVTLSLSTTDAAPPQPYDLLVSLFDRRAEAVGRTD
ncbi:hypothetical protein EV642_128101 [Kribbella sp. VKM Ac-2500]|uniref:hypothetical protein n=1 Tax=Kribbella sp. VKM Ac-2500 TaxID=2512214 RepID=UPI001047005C|nr:hypothetical protein [Kribbella sp. VKM Ac-2500]TCN32191.1 hypothetical protein EV642_128101 [Kribbella sp. VKM Ac-2500]